MTSRRSRSQKLPPSPSMAKLHFKIGQIVYRQEQLKLSFNEFKSQISFFLLEAGDIFSSLAVPLMTLVGLKSAQMAEEGRSSSIFIIPVVETGSETSTFEENYTDSAIMAGKEVYQKQKSQLIQLVQLLKQVEGCVNSSQRSMFQTIEDHKESVNTYMRKAVSFVKQSNHDGPATDISLKLLKVLYDQVCAVLSSVEDGVENLVRKLSEQMCRPMTEYVKSFKAELTTGTCPHLFAALEDMRGVARDGMLELEQARKKVRVAEERELEALNRLEDAEGRIKQMKRYLGFFTDDNKESTGHDNSRNKLLAAQEDQTIDDKLLWELLKKKWKGQQPESPFGPKELLPVGTSSKHHKQTFIARRPTTRAYTKTLAHSSDLSLPLGSSPSLTRKQVLARRHGAC